MKNKLAIMLVLCMVFHAHAQQRTFGKIPLTKVKSELQSATPLRVLYTSLQPVEGTEFRLVKSQTDKANTTHYTYQQYYNGIEIINGILKVHQKNGQILSYNGAYFDRSNIRTSASIPENQVIEAAKRFMGSTDIFWLNEKEIATNANPSLKLCILPNNKTATLNLVYAIGVGSTSPKLKMGTVYVNATTGNILTYKNQLFECFEVKDTKLVHKDHNHDHKYMGMAFASGTAATVYSGSQTFDTEQDGSDYILNDLSRATGSSWNLNSQGLGLKSGIITVNIQNGTDVNGTLTEFTDNNNNWTAAEMSSNEDQYALDTHWGSQVVYDYWKNVHGRNSYNGNNSALLSLVHYGTDYTNAGWGGISNNLGFMVYGDGAGSYTPLTSLDVVAHEIGHGVNNATANLDYELESGAINEGLSDIWAMVIENYSNTNYGTTKDFSLINEENGGGAFRSMANPNLYAQPDTYGGLFWFNVDGCTPDGDPSSGGYNDYCGVHTNSGVLNYWFWLLSQGGSGTNDNSDAFSVTAIGMDDAASIVWQMQNNYLTNTSNFTDVRTYGIQAAVDLFGACSTQEESVTNAFYAVGIGTSFASTTPVITTNPSSRTICTNGTKDYTCSATGFDTIIWQVNDGSGWTDVSDDAIYAGATTETLTVTNPTMSLNGNIYRAVYSNDCGDSITNEVSLTVNESPDVTITVQDEICQGTGGEIIFTFPDTSSRNSIQFSLDGGVNYTSYQDDIGTVINSGLTANQTYNIWVKWGNSDCTTDLGDFTINESTSTPSTATVTTVASAVGGADGRLVFDITDNTTTTAVEISIDGGVTYPYSFADDAGTVEITDLASNTYNVWIRNENDDCPTELGDYFVEEIAYTNIPDSNFELALGNLGHDDFSGDNRVPTTTIEVLTSLDVSNQNISDLTGIEDFTALTNLRFNENNVTIVNLSTLTALEGLYCQYNNLSALDISSNTALRTLFARDNNLTSLDISTNVVLESLWCHFNSISSLDISNNLILEKISFRDNGLTNLTLGNTSALLNVFGQNNGLIEIDFSNHTNLASVSLQNNSLEDLNIKNGNNVNITSINLTGNPALECVLVDDVAYSEANWTNIDATTSFNAIDCIPYTQIPDSNFESALNDLGYDNFLGDNQVPTENIENVTSINLYNTNISDLTGIEGFTSLTFLDVGDNQLTTVDLSANVLLETVNFVDNTISSINLTNNTALEKIILQENALTSLDISTCVNLRELDLRDNNLTSIDLSNNINLEILNAQNNSLTSLDLSSNPLLIELEVNNNALSALDLSTNIALDDFNCSNNSITSLDLTNNSALTIVLADYNNLSNLDIRNGNNTAINIFRASDNANLTCISVDDVAYSEQNWTNIDTGVLFSTTNYCGPYTAIPDADFEIALDYLGYDDFLGDNQVPTEYIETINTLIIPNEEITDLTGIEDFTALEFLNIISNEVGQVDVSQNSNLRVLLADYCALTSLDVSNNPLLERLEVSDNNLTTIDISANTALKELTLFGNQLSSLDVSANLLVEELNVGSNSIESLDLSNLTALTEFYASDNNLSYLNFRNGTNTIIQEFNITNNANLSCVSVDDPNYSNTNWTNKDATTNYAEYCRYTSIPDPNFENALNDLGYDDNLGDLLVPTALIEDITSLATRNLLIADLTGIEDFAALETLDCAGNDLITLDLSQNTALISVTCNSNVLTSIDVSNNPNLEVLTIFSNALTTIDVSANPALRAFRCYNNSSLTALDITNNPNLSTLQCQNTGLTSLDITNNPNLVTLQCQNTSISSLDLSNNSLLEELNIINLNFTSLDISNLPALSILKANNNDLASLDITNNPNLERIFLNSNTNLASIGFSNNQLLARLEINNTSVSNLDLSPLIALTSVTLDNNDNLAFLDIRSGNNTNINSFSATGNANLSCILVDDAAYSTTNWTTIDDTTSFSETYCNYTIIPDANFESQLEVLGLDDIANDGQVPTALISSVTTLDVANSNISDLTGIEDFTALEILDCSDNLLSNLNTTSNSNLKELFAQNNNLTSLDTSDNPFLEILNIANNSITSVDLTAHPNLRDLNVEGTLLSQIHVVTNTQLEIFKISGTNITTLNLDSNSALIQVVIDACDSLEYINLQNGNNVNLSTIQIINNLSLSCVLVDSISYSTTNWTSNSGIFSYSETSCFTAYTTIPDPIFEAELGSRGYDDISNDGQVPTVLIADIISLDLSNTAVTDLTGIADFTSLEILDISRTGFTDLDLSGNTTIKELYCSQGATNSLNVSNMSALQILHCYESLFTSINLSNTNALEELHIYRSNLTSLDVSGHPTLKKIYSYEDSLESINLTGVTTLEELYIYRNSVTDLDVSTNTNLKIIESFENSLQTINLNGASALEKLYVYRNSVTDIDVSTNTSLTTLHAYEGNLTTLNTTGAVALRELQIQNTAAITTLDLTTNTALETIDVSGSNLTSLNLQNGNNQLITNYNSTGTGSLFCILVDDVAYSNTNWTNIGIINSFSDTNCNNVYINLEVFLQGAFINPNTGEESLMRDDLRVNGYLSDTSPYGDGATISDVLKVDDNGINSMVDWVWIELRDATNSNSVIAGKSAVLQRDGDVINGDDNLSFPVEFTNVSPGDYYIAVKHRNHLGIMTSSPITLTVSSTRVDFTNATNEITYGSNAQTTFGMPTNKVAMWAGNVNGDIGIQYSGIEPDTPAILSAVLNDAGNFLNFPTYTISGYSNYDVDMNGNTQYSGTEPDTPFILQNVLAHPGNFLNFSTYQIQEQLPDNTLLD